MKDFNPGLLPSEGMAVLTAPDIDGKGPLYLADFRDSRAVVYKPTGNYIGYSEELGMRLCRGPLRMVDGMWVAQDDPAANESHQDVRLNAELLDFAPL